jgi:hypothetical protein
VALAVYNSLKSLLKLLWEGVKLFYIYAIKMPLVSANNIYFAVFKFFLVSLKSLGIVGELIFSIFGLVWLMWPLAIAYSKGQTEYYIPGVLLTIVLIFKGRNIIVNNQN